MLKPICPDQPKPSTSTQLGFMSRPTCITKRIEINRFQNQLANIEAEKKRIEERRIEMEEAEHEKRMILYDLDIKKRHLEVYKLESELGVNVSFANENRSSNIKDSTECEYEIADVNEFDVEY